MTPVESLLFLVCTIGHSLDKVGVVVIGIVVVVVVVILIIGFRPDNQTWFHSISRQQANRMEFQKIISGRNKVQILHLGFRMQRNQGPQGPLNTTYFNCTTKNCKATLATLGNLDGDLALSYHRVEKHNHNPDVSANIVSSSLHKFRDHLPIR